MNMLSVQYAIDYGKEGFTVVAVSPGVSYNSNERCKAGSDINTKIQWLRTDMGSQDADLDVATGVRALKDLILSATADANGKFYNIHVPGWEHAEGPNQYDGAVIPW